MSNIILPIGSLCFILFCTTKKGWGWENFIAEANAGKGFRIKNFMRFYMSYVLPSVITVLFFVSIYNFFK